MARYRLLFKRSVEKDLRAIPKNDVQRILKRIRNLADDLMGVTSLPTKNGIACDRASIVWSTRLKTVYVLSP